MAVYYLPTFHALFPRFRLWYRTGGIRLGAARDPVRCDGKLYIEGHTHRWHAVLSLVHTHLILERAQRAHAFALGSTISRNPSDGPQSHPDD